MFKKYKKLIILFSVLLLLVGITGTYMWDTHEIKVENILQSRTVEVEINEDYDSLTIEENSEVQKEVEFENTGTASVFLRFTYAQYWESDDELLEGYSDCTELNWATGYASADWFYADGWYYYEYVVPAGESVDILASVTFADDLPEANYNLFFQVETVQVSDEDSVNTSATKQAFGVVATVTDETIQDGAVISGTVDWSVVDE